MYGVYVSKLIRYASISSASDQFLSRGMLLTNKLLLQASRKFYGLYNNIVCPYNLSLSQILSYMFQNIR